MRAVGSGRVFGMSGAIFLAVGLPFLAVGVATGLSLDSVAVGSPEGAWVFPLAFGGMGFLCALVGALLIRTWRRWERERRALVARGLSFVCEVVDLVDDWSVRVNGRPGARAVCRRLDAGDEFDYVSDVVVRASATPRVGDRVRVYVDDAWSPGAYWVDVSSARR